MQKTKIFHKNYTLNEKTFQLKLPIELEQIIPDNDCVRLLGQFVEEMDLTDLYSTYSVIRENQVSPRTMLKILLYAYHECIYSSRKIETACRRDINFMYLLQGHCPPDHTTIARFRTLHFAECAERLMTETSSILMEMKEISGREIFIDGTKIEANANKYTFVWKKAAAKNMTKLMDKSASLIEECVECYDLRHPWHGEVNIDIMEKTLRDLNSIIESEGIRVVHGSGHRKSQLQKHMETLADYIARLKGYIEKLNACGERGSYSKTDNDATFMHMKEDHMMNGQLKPGYNLQAGVDSGYITWLTLSWHPNDMNTLTDFIECMHARLPFQYTTVVADAGYESEENYSYLEKHHIVSMIKPSNYEISKRRKYQNDISRRENMEYNPDGDYYTCRNEKRLYACGMKRHKTGSGYIRETTIYSCNECHDCPYRSGCIKGHNFKVPEAERYKRLEVSRKFERQRAEDLERITSEEGCMLRMNRSIQAEGVFAVMKEDMGFRRFLCRGHKNVLAETVLLVMAHNIGQLHRKIQHNRLQTHLYELKSA